jgi:hypothetical protein
LVLPYLPGLGPLFGFVALPPWMMALLLAITLLYVLANELAKRIFYQRVRF